MTTSTCTHTATIARNNATEASAKASSATARTMVFLPIHGTEREHSSLNVLESSYAGRPAQLTAEIMNEKRTPPPPSAFSRSSPATPTAGQPSWYTRVSIVAKTVVLLIQARAIKPDRSPEKEESYEGRYRLFVGDYVPWCHGSWLRLVDHAGAGRCRRRRLDQEVRRRQQAGRRDSRSRGRVVFVHEQQDVVRRDPSITAWEKSHPAEVAPCDKESGWK
jgi:hypothetical protein